MNPVVGGGGNTDDVSKEQVAQLIELQEITSRYVRHCSVTYSDEEWI